MSILKNLMYSCALMAFCFMSCSQQEQTSSKTIWPSTTNTMKPWTRWWWHGSSVTETGITAELEAYAAAGMGGLELTPIYGVKGDENNFSTYLSEDWVDKLVYTLSEAKRLGLGVDMATGTGWPFGGPWVGADDACRYVAHKKYTVTAEQKLSEKIEFLQSPILRTVNNPKLKLEQIKQPIASNEDLQTLALDQVRFETMIPLHSVMAYGPGGESIELTDKVSNGQLDWVAPTGTWTIYAVFNGWHGKMVERAAPGGEGNVIDHFSSKAIEAYLAKFDSAFEGKSTSGLRAFFNDSYEVDDATGQADWTPLFFSAFERLRGYDLKDHLPALFGDSDDDTNTRVKMDYRETISDLILETFTNKWSAWAKNHDAIIRNQAHGSPSNILDLYAASDIPETEGTDLIKAKMASSAGHVANRPLIAAEAATWLGEHFTTNLGDLKENVDRYFNAGVNHIFYHGTTYSPQEDVWPGRLFYAAIHANPRNSLWNDYPAMNQYIERAQSFLQSGTSDNDILLYLPAHDRFTEKPNHMLEHFDGFATVKHSKDTTIVRHTADWLQNHGYTFDFISDKQIAELSSTNGLVQSGRNSFNCILIPETTYMPIATLKKINALAKNGVKVIFHKQLPTTPPGYSDIQNRKATFEKAISEIKESGIILDSELGNALKQAKVNRETLTDTGLEFNRRKVDNGHLYFISNWSSKDFAGSVSLVSSGKTVTLFDPMSGRHGQVSSNNNGKTTDVQLQLNRGASVILILEDSKSDAPTWADADTSSDAITIDGAWKVNFTKGGPTLPGTQSMDSLMYWTGLPGADFQHFSGTASYSTEFDLSEAADKDWILDLGDVKESATVILNGQEIGAAIGPVYQVYLPKSLLKEHNTLQIDVSNSMANRITAIEKQGKRWQKFYNINVSARKRENLGADRVFTTREWNVRPSGLNGPVTLIPTKSAS